VRPLHNCHFPVMRRQASRFNPQNTQCILPVNPAKAGLPSLPDEKMSRYAKVSKFGLLVVYLQEMFLKPYDLPDSS
jgi:hypothetical protein